MQRISNVGRRLIAACFLCAGSLAAQERAGRFPLPASAVMDTLQRAGLSVDAAQVQMPKNLTSTASQPSLQVTGAELLTDGRLRVRLSCAGIADCQPFFISAAVPAQGTELLTLASLRSTLSTGQAARPLHREALRAGDQVHILLEDNRMRISIPVVAVDSGAVGTEVRVASLDRKLTFHAIVVSATEVRGTLP